MIKSKMGMRNWLPAQFLGRAPHFWHFWARVRRSHETPLQGEADLSTGSSLRNKFRVPELIDQTIGSITVLHIHMNPTRSKASEPLMKAQMTRRAFLQTSSTAITLFATAGLGQTRAFPVPLCG